MSNNETPTATSQPSLKVLGQYVRQLSFANELIKRGNSDAEIQADTQVEIGVDANQRAVTRQYEVVTRFKVVSKNRANGEMLFTIDLDYGGTFQFEDVSDEQLPPLLLIECPRLLFPFARRIIMNLTGDAGLPALNIDSVDFVEMFRAETQRRLDAQKSSPTLN